MRWGLTWLLGILLACEGSHETLTKQNELELRIFVLHESTILKKIGIYMTNTTASASNLTANCQLLKINVTIVIIFNFFYEQIFIMN